MATKKKRLGGQFRADSDAQASWGNKVRAPKASDKGNAMMERGRNLSAGEAGKSTVATRARYSTAVRKTKQSGDTRSSVGRNGGGQANRAISNTMQNGSNEPKSISGRAMQLKTSYKNAVKSRSNYKYPDQMASTANNDARADVYGRVLRGTSVGKKKQDFKNINTRKSTASNMKRKYIRETSDFDLQTGDWAREGARAGANLGRQAKWEGKDNTTGFYKITSPNLRKKPKRKGK